ncbi:unnamed protein product [Didymodactylos carnosus]|uniref:Uncharacterized protein n=1 Tax=Didymodactylos carnosus TaxID=1234261 RepID=A0A815LRA8_9BILA|nr:unnamed protein product [Didymodactylos carnosus]CAF4300755.1 unnamed protein product [Didymodactylos carnosus]
MVTGFRKPDGDSRPSGSQQHQPLSGSGISASSPSTKPKKKTLTVGEESDEEFQEKHTRIREIALAIQQNHQEQTTNTSLQENTTKNSTKKNAKL